MPHIRAIFPQTDRIFENDNSSQIQMFLRNNKEAIRLALAAETDCKPEQIALIAETIPHWLVSCSDNLLSLEFVIDVGSKCVGKPVEVATGFRKRILQLMRGDSLTGIKFGVWVRVMAENHYTEYDPNNLE